MAIQTIKGQQQMIIEEQTIIKNIINHYNSYKIPEYEMMYIKDLEKKISERKEWIEKHENK